MQTRVGMRVSFAQAGEDLIILDLFRALGIEKPSYLDIGAYQPYRLSNTALLYLHGCRGINVEPNPSLIESFNRERPDDTNLNYGIALQKAELDYYLMSVPTLNTFSRESADACVREGYRIIETKKIPVWPVSDIVETHWHGKFPEFLSLDIEGLELPILKAIDYGKSSPIVICVETISFSGGRQGVKNQEVIEFLQAQDYFIYADTRINTILVKSRLYYAK
jgi:FkbM family methyltransferase